MKKILLILSTAALALTARGNTIVFDDLGPGGTYNGSSGYGVGQFGDNPSPLIGARFTAGASGTLATIDLGLTRSSFAGIVGVFLYGDAGGSPDNASQTFLGSAVPAGDFGTTNNSLASFTVAGNVLVTADSVYWLVLKPFSAHGGGVWNESLTTFGAVGVGNGSPPFGWTVSPDSHLPAFRITAFETVSDSGNTILLLLGSVVALLALRRTVFTRTN